MNSKLILEICQNHNGSKELLEEMIHAASESGANYLKIQDIKSKELTKRKRFEKGKLSKHKVITIKRPYQNEYDRLCKLDMDTNFYSDFVSLCKKYKCKSIVTPFTYNSFDRIKNHHFDYIKIASYDCSAIPFLNKIKKLKIPMIVSTGASTKIEIEKARVALNKNLESLLHCITIYPTPLEKCNLSKINKLKKIHPKIGWSDHTLFERDGHIASVAASLLGVSYIERHFTILPKTKTKDGPISINPKETNELIKLLKLSKEEKIYYLEQKNKNWKIVFGNGTWLLSHEEKLNRDYYRGRFAVKKNGNYKYNWQ